MAEAIGLEGRFDLGDFDSGIARYNKAVDGAISATNKAASSFGQSWNSMGSTVLKATGIMGGAVAAGVAAIGAGLVGMGVAAFSASADFEASTKKMTSQLGLTADEAKVFDETMRAVFANNFGASIDDVAASLVEVEMAFGRIGGTEGAGELQFATEAALALRDAFGVEVVESTDAAVTLMDQFGISSEQAFDLLTAGFQTGLNSSDDFLDTIGEYSTQFANGGASVEEFFGLMRTGLQGGMLGTDKAADAFKEFQVRILDGSTATADALGLLGINADEFTGKIASGEMTISEAFTKITQKFHTVEDQAVLMQAGVGLLGTQFEDLGVDGVLALNMLDTSFADVSGATATLNTQYETFGQAVTGMWRRLIVAMTPFTDMLLNLVNMAMPHVMKAFDSFEDTLSTVIGAVQAVIGVFGHLREDGELLSAAEFGLSAQTAALVDRFIGLALIISDKLAGAFAFIQEHAAAFQGALIGIGAVLAAAGLTAGIAALAGAIASLASPIGIIIISAALLGAAWNTNFLGIRDTTLAVVDAISSAFAPLTAAIAEFGSGALGEIVAFVSGTETEFTNLNAIWDGAIASVGNLVTAITEKFPMLAPVFTGFGIVVGLIMEQVKAQFTLVTDAISAAIGIVTSLIAGDWAGAWQSAQDFVGAFYTYIETTLSNVGTVFSGLGTAIAENLPGWKSSLAEWGTAAWQWLQDAGGQLLTTLGGWSLALTTFVTGQLPTWQTSLAEWALAAWQWIADASVIVNDKMTEWGTAVNGYVTTNLPTWQATLTEWGTAAWQWIVDAVAIVGETMAAWGTAVTGYVTANLPTWLTTLGTWGTAAWQWIQKAIPVVVAQIGAWGTAVLGYVTTNLPTWISNLAEWATAAWEWIVDAVPLVRTQIGTWGTTIFNYVTGNLPTLTANLLGWTTAIWEWIVNAIPLVTAKLGEWWDGIGGYLTNTALPALTAQMLTWATALVSWIGSAAADALPHLGEWLGKITAWTVIGAIELVLAMAKFAAAIISWIPGAIAQLPAKIVELKDALIGWIAGTGGAGGEGTLVAEASPAMDKFKMALLDALTSIKDGFLEGVQGFVRAFADTMSEYIDWEFVGTNIMTFVRNGISSMLDPIIAKVTEIVEGARDVWTTIVDWLQTGKDVIQDVIDGFQAMLDLGTLATKAGEIAQSGFDAFMDINWLQLGKDIIDGILKGLKANAASITDYIKGLAQGLLDSVTGIFDSSSPSKVMIELGKDIIEGWIIGMQSMEKRLYRSVTNIANGVTRIAAGAGTDALSVFTSALNRFSTIAGGRMDKVDLLDRISLDGIAVDPFDQLAVDIVQQERSTLSFLEQQADLIEAIRESGGDPAEVLKGVTLGPNANPAVLARIVGETMRRLNMDLIAGLNASVSGLDKTIEDLRDKRESIADIEEKFTDQHLSTLDHYAQQLEDVDRRIAQAESDAIRTGAPAYLGFIEGLDKTRKEILANVEAFFQQRKEMERLLATPLVTNNQRAQGIIDQWRKDFIDPILKDFDNLTVDSRKSMLNIVGFRITQLQDFIKQLPMISFAEKQIGIALEGFGAGARSRADHLLNMLYSPQSVHQVGDNIAALNEFAASLSRIKGELNFRASQRQTTGTIIERMMGSFDQMTAYENAINDIDQAIANTQEHILASGSEGAMDSIRGLDDMRADRTKDLENFIRQTQMLNSIMKQVKAITGPGQASAERFLKEQIQPIMDAFSAPMRAEDRDAWIKAANTRVAALNSFIEQMRAVEKLQARVAGNAAFDHLADEFALLQDISLPEAERTKMIGQLNSYITQMMRLHDIQKDISEGRGINPIVERFASQRLDELARQLENINLTEAERNRLIEQYRIEQERVLALQQKQQQLDIVNEQLALIKQLRDLDDQEGWGIDVKNILSGISLGVNASIDDLMLLTGKVLDEMIRFANHELGIASPSKVFAKVGANIMAGLAHGIDAGMRQPMDALRGAAGNLVPYSLTQRSLAVNMGGVTINNGMDDVMFEARIRQIVRNELM